MSIQSLLCRQETSRFLPCTAGVTPLLFSAVQAGVPLALTCRYTTCLGQQHLFSPADAQCIKLWLTWLPLVQVRGSIPLYWLQQGTTKLKPDILLQRFDPLYRATQLHFEVRPAADNHLSLAVDRELMGRCSPQNCA